MRRRVEEMERKGGKKEQCVTGEKGRRGIEERKSKDGGTRERERDRENNQKRRRC